LGKSNAIEYTEHRVHGGFGPASTLTLNMTDGSSTTLPAPGRGFDQNRDGAIDASEGIFSGPPRSIVLYADSTLQSGADHVSLIRLIQRGIDADGDGQVELDGSRIYFFGQSLGAHDGIQLLPYVQAVRAATFVVPLGTSVDQRRLAPGFRPVMGSFLAARTQSLLNSGNGLTSIGGVALGMPSFNENMPFRDEPPLINDIAGAMVIQRVWDRIEWRGQTGNAAVFAHKLRNSPPSEVRRPFYILIGRGDQAAPVVESATMIRDAGLEDRTVLYRHDLFFAANPASVKTSHTVYRFQDATAPTNVISAAIQEQFSQFFVSDGLVLKQTSHYLETPISSPLPKVLDFIP
jgi:hypothetical protein